MGKRGEVAGGPDGALGRDDGGDALCEHRFDLGDDFPPDARGAATEGKEFQRHHQAGDIAGHRVAHAAAMGQDQVALEGGGVLGRDLERGEFAKARVDAVNGGVPCGGGGDLLGCGVHPKAGRGVQLHGTLLAVDFFDLCKCDGRGGQDFRRQGGLR